MSGLSAAGKTSIQCRLRFGTFPTEICSYVSAFFFVIKGSIGPVNMMFFFLRPKSVKCLETSVEFYVIFAGCITEDVEINSSLLIILHDLGASDKMREQHVRWCRDVTVR